MLTPILLASAVAWTGCSAAGKSVDRETAASPAIAVAAITATEQPIARFIRATGTLTADAQAEVAAETAGRVNRRRSSAARRSRKARAAEDLPQRKRTPRLKEAEANAAQIEARLGLTSAATFDVNPCRKCRTRRRRRPGARRVLAH